MNKIKTHPIHHIVYHNDLDGFGSAAIIKMHLMDEEVIPKERIRMHCMRYDGSLDFDDVMGPEDAVYMVDFMLQPVKRMERLSRLLKDNGNLLWIDHHVSARQAKESSTELIGVHGIVMLDYAAIELTWRHIYPGSRMPTAVALLGRYDVWDHSGDVYRWDEEILPFQYGMKLRNYDPATDEGMDLWKMLFDTYHETANGRLCQEIVNDGMKVLSYVKGTNEAFMKSNGFEARFLPNDWNVIAINGSLRTSMTFDGFYDKQRHDAMVVFGLSSKNTWVYSLYSETRNVADVAMSLGGGGHPQAAGFSTTDPPEFFFEHKTAATRIA